MIPNPFASLREYFIILRKRYIRRLVERQQFGRLVKRLRGPIACEAEDALVQSGNDAVSTLTEALASPHPDIRSRAASALGRIGDLRAIPGLTDALKDSDANVRHCVLAALKTVAIATAPDVLAKKLKQARCVKQFAEAYSPSFESDPSVRAFAASVLGAVGDDIAVRCLLNMLGDPDSKVVSSVREAVLRIDWSVAGPVIGECLRYSHEDRRIQVCDLLGHGRAVPAIRVLWETLADTPPVKEAAMRAIRQIVPQEAFIPCVIELFELIGSNRAGATVVTLCGDYGVAGCVCALRKYYAIWVRPTSHLDYGIRSLQEGIERAHSSDEVLDVIDKHVVIPTTEYRIRAAVEPLHAPAATSGPGTRRFAAWRVETRAGRDAEREVADRAISSLHETDWSVRRCAAFALGYIGDEPAAEPLGKLSEDKSPRLRRQALAALGEIGGHEAARLVSRALLDTEKDVRLCALQSLVLIGDVTATEPLRRSLHDDDDEVRERAISALGILQDREAVKPLIGFLSNPRFRLAAVRALGQIQDAAAVDPLSALLLDTTRELTSLCEQAEKKREDAKSPYAGYAAWSDSDREYNYWSAKGNEYERAAQELEEIEGRIREFRDLESEIRYALCRIPA